MDTLLCNDDGDIVILPVSSGATEEILAFHYGSFDNHYGDGTVENAATNGRIYDNTPPASVPLRFGTIGTPSTVSGQTTYSWTPPSTRLNGNVLVVAGGGGGGGVTGTGASGGGGAGGLVFDIERTVTSGAQTIVVGNGGAGGGNARVNGENGKNSTAFGLTANGGGGGGGSSDGTSWNAGSAGGSGGGGGGGDVNPNGAGGASTQPGTNTGVYIDGGFAGGGSLSSSGDCGGGGGGAGEKGDDFLGSTVGNGYNIQGGDGLDMSSHFGTTYGDDGGYFAGGGGAFARNDNIPRAGGLGGGGAGGSSGVSHTGGGGGGRDGGVLAGNGGSGIVAIRYIVDASPVTTGIDSMNLLPQLQNIAGTTYLTGVQGDTAGTFVSKTRGVLVASVTIDQNTQGIIYEGGATGWGFVLYVVSGTVYCQAGNGSVVGGNVEVSWPIEASLTTSVVTEIGVSMEAGYSPKGRLFINTLEVDNVVMASGGGEGLAGSNAAGSGKIYSSVAVTRLGSTTTYTDTIYTVTLYPNVFV